MRKILWALNYSAIFMDRNAFYFSTLFWTWLMKNNVFIYLLTNTLNLSLYSNLQNFVNA